MTAEGLAPVQDLIHQDADALDEVSKWRLRKHLQKLFKAAKTSFAERGLQDEQIKFLHRVNDEAKVRRSTPSLILGKAKVMSYEDLEAARARRAAGKSASGKKTGRKSGDSQATEADVDETEPLPLEVSELVAPVVRMV